MRLILALVLGLVAGGASAACDIKILADLPVTMAGAQPMIEARINGAPASFVADSGAFYSILSPAAAAENHLPLGPAPFGLRFDGVGGSAVLSVAKVKDFTLAGIPDPNVEFLVGGSETSVGQGVIGRNILNQTDVEFDLAGGAIRLIRADHCGGLGLAYWAKPPLTYSAVDMVVADGPSILPAIIGAASVNGRRITVIFDTGASRSVLSLAAAKRLGIGPAAPGVVPAGMLGGFGPRLVRTWIAPVDVFEIGGEKIEHTHLVIGDIGEAGADMYLGADFFLSHRIYVANSQRRIYFSYNGGAVFNLTPGSAPPPPAIAESAPTDAAAFARRGAAEAARRDFPAAFGDFGKAMELDAKNADYPYERGVTHLQAGQPVLAMADFDRTLALAPTDTRALIARAGLHYAAHDHTGALDDLDAASKALAPEANERLVLANLYRLSEAPARAVAQYDLWIKVRPDDRGLAEALGGRCWARMLLNVDLDKAMADCQGALRRLPTDWGALDGRAFINLRQGASDKAIADFDQALKLQTKNAWPYYGRGLAELKQGRADAAKADIAAATAINPNIAKAAGRYGLAP